MTLHDQESYRQGVIDGIAQERERQGWIPVSEKLPDKGGLYTVTQQYSWGDVIESNSEYFHADGWEKMNVIAWREQNPYQPKEAIENDKNV